MVNSVSASIQNLSNHQLIKNLESQLEVERRASYTIILYLKEIRTRRLFAERGYSSLFEMLVKHFRLPESSANQRIKALELMTEVPEAKVCFRSGDANLTTLALAQREIRREEKATGEKIPLEKKTEIVELISRKTQVQVEKDLMRVLPNAAMESPVKERRVSEEAVRLSLTLPDRVRDKLMKLKDRWAHVDSSLDYVTLIERCADLALEKTDRTSKTEGKSDMRSDQASRAQLATQSAISTAKRPNYYSVKTDKILWRRAGSRCEFVDQLTGRTCSSHFKLQRDHIIPIAKGGSNEIENLRLLCQTHNLLMARRHFGDRARQVPALHSSLEISEIKR